MPVPLSKSLEARRTELRLLETVIADRQAYHEQQERVIEEVTEAGNIQLLELNHAILLAKQELRQAKTSLHGIRQDQINLQREVSALRHHLTQADPDSLTIDLVQIIE